MLWMPPAGWPSVMFHPGSVRYDNLTLRHPLPTARLAFELINPAADNDFFKEIYYRCAVAILVWSHMRIARGQQGCEPSQA